MTLTTDEPIEPFETYISGNVSDAVGGRIDAPSGATCEIDVREDSGFTLAVSSIDDGVPSGFATFVDLDGVCEPSEIMGGGGIGFGLLP